MNKESLKKFLEATREEGIGTLYNRGYQWFKSYYLPRLRLADELLPHELELIADAWYLVGDVYDFNEMPLLAIEAYRKVLEYDEEADGAYRELAHMYERVGDYQKALEGINKALEFNPDNEELMDAKAEIQDSINYTTEPYLTEENVAWKWAELLGNERPQAVVQQAEKLGDQATVEELQRLAQAYAALEKDDQYLQTWQKIVALEEPIAIHYADWFYLPPSVAEKTAIWKLWLEAADYVQELEMTEQESLDVNYEGCMSYGEMFRAVVEYHYYTLTDNKKGLAELAKAFPKWEEVQR
jgi:tetratricopeptide (TPR) repeat protein